MVMRSWPGQQSSGHACYACDLPVISASLGGVGSCVTRGALLCMLAICAWPVQLGVGAGWRSGSGCRWRMCTWSFGRAVPAEYGAGGRV
jgi:hypothetical protein